MISKVSPLYAGRSAVRAAYVAAARAVIEAEGREALTARRLGRETRLAPASLYTYFGGLDDLLDAVRDSYAADLVRALTPPARPVPQTVDELAGLLAAYADHLLARPHVFALLFPGRPVRVPEPKTTPTGFESLWADSFAALVASGLVDPADVADLATTLIYAVHGRILLTLTYPDAPRPASVHDDLQRIAARLIPAAGGPA